MRGEVIKKENVTPRGIPAPKKLKKIGMDEHEQKGVIAPKMEAKKLPIIPLCPIHFFTLFFGRKVLKTPIAKIIIYKSRRILRESYTKKLSDAPK